MKRFLCVLFSVLLLVGCFAACTDTADSNETPETSEEQSAADEVTAEASDSYLEPTEEELNQLFYIDHVMHGYDSESGDAVHDAYSFALFDGGVYMQFADGKVFAKSERIVSEEKDPRGLTISGNDDGTYEYLKTPAESVDRFMREIMNVEPDHNCDGHFNGQDVTSYYLDGYYYTMFGIYGGDSIVRVDDHSVTDDGWDEVKLGYYDDFDYGKLEETSTVTAKIVMIDGRRFWSIKNVTEIVPVVDE